MGVPKQPSQGAGVQAATSRRDEEGVLGPLGKLGPGFAEIARHPVPCLLAERNDPLLVALAADVDVLLLEVDVTEIEVDGLTASEAGGVDQLGERSVSQPQGALGFQSGQLCVDLPGLWHLGKPAPATRRERGIGDSLRTERMTYQGADRGELAGDRRGRKLGAAPPQLGRVLGKGANVDVVETLAAA